MSKRYRLLCPIARSLDRLGDRWTLLVLRDLHAGPMRFTEIADGLPGLATNLLSTRLEKLIADGLVERSDDGYRLTALGRRTDRLLFELALLGMQFPPDPDLKRPGHLRLVAVTLESALRRVVTKRMRILAELELDGESFTIRVERGDVSVRYGAPEQPDVRAKSSYEPMMAAAAGEVTLDEFRRANVRLEGSAKAKQAFAELMGAVMTRGFAPAAATPII